MGITVKKCDLTLLPKLVSLVDNEFIYSKGRDISLAIRYPNLFNNIKIENIFIACSEESILATTTVRRFSLANNGRTWNGAMIGFVYTLPEARGHGLGSLVMNSIIQELRESNIDFAVLWTGIHSFYERLGWFSEDEGAFGTINTSSFYDNENLIDPVTYRQINFDWIEIVRSKYLASKVLRQKDDYAVVPPSVNSVEYFICNNIGAAEGYAIVGRKEETGYIYEMVGSPDVFPALIKSIGKHFDTLLINDNSKSLSGKWLTEKNCVEWLPQNQAMWYRLTDAFRDVSCKSIYIPYYDRI